jgi:hypothetical protein
MKGSWSGVLPALGRLALLLPILMLAWYQLGPRLIPGLAWLLEPLLQALWPDTVLAVEAAGRKIILITQVVEPTGFGLAYTTARKGVLFNPFTYSYGLPLFAALALASSAAWWRHLIRVTLGLSVLTLGLCFSVAVSVLFLFQFDGIHPGFHALGTKDLNDGFVQYAHFLGFNLVPRVLPLVMWIVLYRDWLSELIQASRGQPAEA